AVAAAGEFAKAVGAHRPCAEAELEAAQFARIGPRLARSLRASGMRRARDGQREREAAEDCRIPHQRPNTYSMCVKGRSLSSGASRITAARWGAPTRTAIYCLPLT